MYRMPLILMYVCIVINIPSLIKLGIRLSSRFIGAHRASYDPTNLLSGAYLHRPGRDIKESIPSNIIWPSYVAHLSQAQPNQTFGPTQVPFVYRIPGESKDIGTQIAFSIPGGNGDDIHNSTGNQSGKDDAYENKTENNYANKRNDNRTSPNYMCKLEFLDLSAKWGPAEWAAKVPEAQDFTVFRYLEAEVAFSPEDTWNSQPAVNYDLAYAVVYINSTGVHITAGAMNCTSNLRVVHFWLQAVGNQSCDLSWLEAVQPFSGLVIQRYNLS